MNGSTRSHTAMNPLTAPIPIDTARAAMAPSTNRPSEPSIAIAATMAASRTLAPSERSTPLTSTTTNCASDASPSTTIWRDRFVRLATLRKSSDAIAAYSARAATTTQTAPPLAANRASCFDLTCPPLRRRPRAGTRG